MNDKLSELQQLFLNHCKVESFESVVGGKLTCDKWKGKAAKWQEATTTSPSGRHLGHFKVLIQRFAEDLNTEECQEMQQKQTDLIDAHLGLINYSQEKRYSCERWKNIVNFVIYKEIGNNKICKICILHQHEVDYSLNIGDLWKEMITMSEKWGTINR
eukprot:7262338-Ditylum_brightwellii.AAC.1